MLNQLRYFYEQSKGFRLKLLLSLTLGLLSIIFGLLFIYVSKCIVDIATGKMDADLWTWVGILAFMLFMRLALRGIVRIDGDVVFIQRFEVTAVPCQRLRNVVFGNES